MRMLQKSSQTAKKFVVVDFFLRKEILHNMMVD